MKFLFDLDGTVTSQETLPIMANHFKVQEQIAELTKLPYRAMFPLLRVLFVVYSQNVFNMFETLLPLRGIKVRAYDIDTYDDYFRVLELTKNWKL